MKKYYDMMAIIVVIVLLCTSLSTVQSRSSGASGEDSGELRSLVDDLRQEMLKLKSDNINANEKLSQLTIDNANIARKLNDLSEENNILKSQQHMSDNNMKEIKEENGAIKLQMEELNKQYNDMKKRINEGRNTNNNDNYNKENNDDDKDNNKDNNVLSTGVVAFFAKIAGFTGSSVEDSIIPFDVVDLNIGNGYDPATGEFTPPVSGIYEISYEGQADVGSCGSSDACVRLQVNTVVISDSCTDGYASGGTAVTVQLATQDSVTVATDSAVACVSLSGSAPNNKFSGHLVYQII